MKLRFRKKRTLDQKGLYVYRIESLLSARLFLKPQLIGDWIYFLSNSSGRLSLYRMKFGGSVPEPLLPPHIALQNPHLIDGESFFVFPGIDKILVMIDRDGDENYQPMVIPLEGGFPEPAFGDFFDNYRVHCGYCDSKKQFTYFIAESREERKVSSFQANLATGEMLKMGESMWGCFVDGVNTAHNQAILIDNYTIADHVLYIWNKNQPERKLLYGIPLEERKPDQIVPLNSISFTNFTSSGHGLLFITSLFSDSYGLGYLDLDDPREASVVEISGVKHAGGGELNELRHLKGEEYLLVFNIDGCSWVYQASFDEKELHMKIDHVLVGEKLLSNGVLEAISYDEASDRFALSFSSATFPTQIYTLEGSSRQKLTRHTNEHILGIPEGLLSTGEDASFTSFDGTLVSARLYLPSPVLGYKGPRPLVYYVHGGPQGQERPDFSWFSMPLIQFLTLNGLAVFVPNVRGSTGYGLNYAKQVDRDWGGQDRLDHVHAMQKILRKDERLDVTRTGVTGRSYGGYMTLTLIARHPELWAAAVDMFGPYDLLTFSDRIPESWKPYFILSIGDPMKDRQFMIERSPRTYMDQIACPLMVIQGKNDPRVIERESLDVVEQLRSKGKDVEYLMFEDEGHDVFKFENRVTAYNAITDFFKKHLKP
jgi:pimeloyl-ACP methyl ester carboxylesterase